MKKFAIYLCLLSVLAAVSCREKALRGPCDDSSCFVLSGNLTRTTLGQQQGSVCPVLWEAGDNVLFGFDDRDFSTAVATTAVSGTSAEFCLHVPEGAGRIWAVRFGDVSRNKVAWKAGKAGVARVNLPSVFDGEWTFDEVNALAGGGSVSAGIINMDPVFGLLRFTLERRDIDRVVVRFNGKSIADTFEYDVDNGILSPEAGSGSHSFATFICSGQKGPFFIPLPEGDYAGVSMEMYSIDDDLLLGILSVPSVKVIKGRIINLGTLDSRISAPAVRIDGSADRSVVSSFGQTRTLPVTADKMWSVTASDGLKVNVTTGQSGTDLPVKVTFPENTSSSEKRYSVRFSSSDASLADLVVDFVQARKPDYEVFFRLYPDEFSKDMTYRNWDNVFVEKLGTFGYYTLKEVSPSVSSERVKVGFFSNNGDEGNLGYNEAGFMIGYVGGGYGGYIEFPAVEGRRLSSVEAFFSASTSNQTVYSSVIDTDGNVVSGGEIQTNAVNSSAAGRLHVESVSSELNYDPGSRLYWNLSGTQPGRAYRLNFSSRGMIRWFNFSYE